LAADIFLYLHRPPLDPAPRRDGKLGHKTVAVFPVHCSALQFTQYLKDMGWVTFEVVDELRRVVIGRTVSCAVYNHAPLPNHALRQAHYVFCEPSALMITPLFLTCVIHPPPPSTSSPRQELKSPRSLQNKPTQGVFPVLSEDSRKIAELHVLLSLTQSALPVRGGQIAISPASPFVHTPLAFPLPIPACVACSYLPAIQTPRFLLQLS